MIQVGQALVNTITGDVLTRYGGGQDLYNIVLRAGTKAQEGRWVRSGWRGDGHALVPLMRDDPGPPSPLHRPTEALSFDGKRVVITVTYETRPVGPLDVDQERDRRMFGNFTFGGRAFQLDPESQNRITAMGADARFAVLAGARAGNLRWADSDRDFGWIATDNSEVPMDAPTMANFSTAAKLWVMRHIFAARAIKNMTPIPEDYAADARWPSAT